MRQDDPLEKWLLYSELVRTHDAEMPRAHVAELQTALRSALQRLDRFLEIADKKADMQEAWRRSWFSRYDVYLEPEELTLAQELYRRVWERGGAGSQLIQEELLDLIAAANKPSSVPFWQGLLDYTRPRDQFAGQRRLLALAALAFLAIRRDLPEAYTALRTAAGHTRVETRALAVRYLGRAYLEAERAVPADTLDAMRAIAVKDKAFLPRFQARRLLAQAGAPVPLDHPGGAYHFKVKCMWDKRIFRTIALRAEQSLDDLHLAIQRAIAWDNDHLYSFFMNGKEWDRRYGFACPFEDDHPPWADEAVVGELGLVQKHKFLYYFDYGDGNRFEVEVVNIEAQASAGKYPRVVDSQGAAPPQYGW